MSFAAGALLVMLIDSMIPDAVQQAGKVAGLVTVFGFAVAAALLRHRLGLNRVKPLRGSRARRQRRGLMPAPHSRRSPGRAACLAPAAARSVADASGERPAAHDRPPERPRLAQSYRSCAAVRLRHHMLRSIVGGDDGACFTT